MDAELLERLEQEISKQTRNGRTDVYIQVDDLNQLGYKIDPNKTGRVYVDVGYLKQRIRSYKFKGQLHVVPEKNITFKDLEKEIRSIETSEQEDIRDDI